MSGAVAVIGAGISGLVCAERLRASGLRVRVFDKARGPGGRVSTRRHGDLRFDHGAQYMTARDPRFRARVREWVRDGVVARWTGRVVALESGRSREKNSVERWVGVPGMSAIGRRLAEGLDVTAGERVVSLRGRAGRWELVSESGPLHGIFERVVLAMPPLQVAALVGEKTGFGPVLSRVRMLPGYAAMIAFRERVGVDFDAAFVNPAPLSWIARNGSKPGRPEAESWVLHAAPDWASRHGSEPDAVEGLLEAFRALAGSLPPVLHRAGHRWAYALPAEPLPGPYLIDASQGLAACGDWCGGPRVEGAYMSGLALGDRLAADTGSDDAGVEGTGLAGSVAGEGES